MRARVGRVLRSCGAPIPVAVVLVAHEAPALLHLVHLLLRPPVVSPLPHVPDHVLVTELAGGELGDRIGAPEPVLLRVELRELASPDVCPVLVPRHPLVAPGVEPVLLARPAGHLPLSLRGQPLARPLTEGHGVIP